MHFWSLSAAAEQLLEIEKNVVVRTFTIHHRYNGSRSLFLSCTQTWLHKWLGITCSICQMHNAYVVIYKQLHLFLQLADSNAKEIKSKTKEWNDKIKQDNVSETDAVYCIIFCVHWFPRGLCNN